MKNSTKLFFLFLVLFIIMLNGCTNTNNNSNEHSIDISFSSSSDNDIVDFIVIEEYGVCQIITEKLIEKKLTATFYDKMERVLIKRSIGPRKLGSSPSKYSNPSFLYRLTTDKIHTRLVHKIIIE